MSVVQTQWSLDSTSSSALTVARGLLAASTSDNVHPIALMACEKFGNTLAICPETLSKVEKIIVPSPPAAYVQFLKAYVGFFNDDCASYLGTTAAGVRFLGLAAALTTTMNLTDATKALNLMIRNTAADLTLLPSRRHLQDLLSSVEQRCHRGGFASSVAGWDIMLRPGLKAAFGLGGTDNDFGTEGDALENFMFRACPTLEMMERLVDLFRQIARVGSPSIAGATIRTLAALPWIVAFTKWCLGHPPSVSTEYGVDILNEPNSAIRIVVPFPQRVDKAFESDVITIHYHLRSGLDALIATDTSRYELQTGSRNLWQGMVDLRTYAAFVLDQEEFLASDQDVRPVLAHCLPLLSRHMCKHPEDLPKPSTDMSISSLLPRLTSRDFSRAYRMLFDNEPPDWGESLETAGLIKGFHYSRLSALIQLCFELLALSLLEPGFPPPLAKLPVQLQLGGREMFQKMILGAEPPLRSNAVPGFDDIFRCAQALLGHDLTFGLGQLMTSGKGQVAFPRALDKFQVEPGSQYDLAILPGIIRYEGQIYSQVRTPSGTYLDYDDARDYDAAREGVRLTRIDDLDAPREILTPENDFTDRHLTWIVAEQDLDTLMIEVALTSRPKQSIMGKFSPWPLFTRVAGCLLADSCAHPPDSPVDVASAFTSKTWRWQYRVVNQVDFANIATEGEETLSIIPFAGADDLRLFAAAYDKMSRKCLLRKRACMGCCIKFCEENKINTLIL